MKSLREKMGKLSNIQAEVETEIGGAAADAVTDGVKEMAKREA